ncbi:hypothetical protein KKB40_02350, partial [Patescibacteria group bacterium]|nr:hypothetical protein [Patescibacteria group bacterium]
ENIHFVNQIGELSLYELENDLVLPKIFTTSKLKGVKNIKKIFDVLNSDFFPLNKRSFITTDQKLDYQLEYKNFASPKISYKTINPTLYEISVENAKDPFVLVLNNTFHPLWQLSVDSKKVDKHFRVNGFANGYLVEKTGNYKMSLEFEGQNIVKKSIIISLVSFALLSVSVIANNLTKKE